MALEISNLLDDVRKSRAFFFKHLDGLTPEQWTWKPYPECKSVRETLVHMHVNDDMALRSLQGEVPKEEDFARAFTDAETATAADDNDTLLARLKAGHEALLTYLSDTFDGKPLDTPVALWGGPPRPVGLQIPHLSSEDFYHAGQVGYIRLATDPGWDYYTQVYGEG